MTHFLHPDSTALWEAAQVAGHQPTRVRCLVRDGYQLESTSGRVAVSYHELLARFGVAFVRQLQAEPWQWHPCPDERPAVSNRSA